LLLLLLLLAPMLAAVMAVRTLGRSRGGGRIGGGRVVAVCGESGLAADRKGDQRKAGDELPCGHNGTSCKDYGRPIRGIPGTNQGDCVAQTQGVCSVIAHYIVAS
jgi:hypothetical protein